MNTLSEIVMIFNVEAWDYVTKYVYSSEPLKKLFNYCSRPIQESEQKSVLLSMEEVPWSDSASYVEAYANLLTVMQEQSEKNENFKYLVARTERATEKSDLVGNYSDHPFFTLNWDSCLNEFSNNWFIYSPDLNLRLPDPYHLSLRETDLHTVAFSDAT